MSSIYSNITSVITQTGVPNLNRWSNPDSIGTLTVTSLTQTAGVATAMCLNSSGQSPGFIVGDTVSIQGATPSGYNGTGVIVTGSLLNGFAFEVDSGLSSPATGGITATMILASGRINYWLLQADAWINAHFLAKQIYLRIGQASISQGPVSAVLTNKWATAFTKLRLYESARGLTDDDPIHAKLQADFDACESELRQCAADNGIAYGFDAGRTWPMAGGEAPVGYAPNFNGGWERGERIEFRPAEFFAI